jgi:ubiquinone/menaquinone biosynthesis C-methylase UbiE
MIDFDTRAKDWDADPVRVERARAVAEEIRARVPLTADMTALEYGCGTGLLSFALQPYLARITLADTSEGMLAVLKEKLASSGIRNMTPVKLDLLTDPLPRERYQLIYSLMTLHHLPDTDQVLRDFHTLLDRPGFLCIADLEQEDGSFHGPDFSGHKGFAPHELTARAAGAGFRNIEFATVFKMTRAMSGKKGTFPLFLMVAERA